MKRLSCARRLLRGAGGPCRARPGTRLCSRFGIGRSHGVPFLLAVKVGPARRREGASPVPGSGSCRNPIVAPSSVPGEPRTQVTRAVTKAGTRLLCACSRECEARPYNATHLLVTKPKINDGDALPSRCRSYRCRSSRRRARAILTASCPRAPRSHAQDRRDRPLAAIRTLPRRFACRSMWLDRSSRRLNVVHAVRHRRG